jgi:Iap family predicted aminopeptidase
MEVRIGVKGAARELVVDSNQSADEIEKAVAAALKDDAPTITLSDDKGRRIVVATDKFAYIEIAESEGRRVGFGAI